jgi:diketogulonate reductase-like aldo/keto reductase
MNAQSTVMLRTGNRMPIIGLGTWQIRDARTVETALELGYRMIDTSGDYGNQPEIGEALKRTNVPRTEVYLVTKIEPHENAYGATKENVEELQVDHVDLVLIHHQPRIGAGENLWEGLLRARSEGLTKDIGVSNYSAKLLKALIVASGEIPAVNQIEWSPFAYSQEMLDFCHTQNIIIQAYSPLTRREKLKDKVLVRMASKYRKTPGQLLLRWNLQLGTVPLPKASQRKHLLEDLDLFDFEISGEDMSLLRHLNEDVSLWGGKPEHLE